MVVRRLQGCRVQTRVGAAAAPSGRFWHAQALRPEGVVPPLDVALPQRLLDVPDAIVHAGNNNESDDNAAQAVRQESLIRGAGPLQLQEVRVHINARVDGRMLVDATVGFVVGFRENSLGILQKMNFKIAPKESTTHT